MRLTSLTILFENNCFDTEVEELYNEPELEPSTSFSNTSLPSIITEKSPNVVGVLGKEVGLTCYVNNLGNRTV